MKKVELTDDQVAYLKKLLEWREEEVSTRIARRLDRRDISGLIYWGPMTPKEKERQQADKVRLRHIKAILKKI